MPKVSIIVPVYNVEKYLPDCIESILAQTFSDIEVILVDDGSPDKCPVICDEYAAKDDRVRVIHKENGGVSNARNMALQYITGEYLTFCDADDRYVPTWLNSLVTEMEEKNADVVVGGYVRVPEDNLAEGDPVQFEPELICCETMDEKILYCIRYILGCRHGWEIWSRLFRTKYVKENQMKFCETCGNFAEDLGFTLEYALYASRFAAIKEAGYLYTIRSTSMMQTSKGSVKLDCANEVALDVIEKVQKRSGLNQKWFPLLHYLILNDQYARIIQKDELRNFHQYRKQITRQKEWKYFTRRMMLCYGELKELYGRDTARYMLNTVFYYLHGSWHIFVIGNDILERINRI